MKNKVKFKTKLYATLLGLCAVFGFTDSSGQDTGGGSVGDLAIGAKVGMNFNHFSQPGITTGGSIGGYARYSFLNFLEAQGEIIYSLKGGGRREFTRTTSSLPGGLSSSDVIANSIQYINRDVRLHTIEIPISARLSLPELNGGAIVPKLIIGGSYAVNLGAFEKSDAIFYFPDGTSGLVSDTRENVKGDYFPHQYSIHTGIALDFNLENSKVFTMEFRYRKGLNNLNKVNTIVTELTDRLYSSGMSINFSYRIF